jgi:integrase
LREANERAKALHGEWAAKFHALRTGVPVAVDLPALRAHLLGRVERRIEGFDRRVPNLSDEQRNRERDNLAMRLLDAKSDLESGPLSESSQDWLAGYKYVRSTVADAEALTFAAMELEILVEALEDKTRTFPLRVAHLAARRSLVESSQARSNDKSILAAPAAQKNGHKLADALAEWSKVGRLKKTVSAFTRHVRQFELLTNNPDLESIDKRVATRFKDALTKWAIEEGKVASTADNVMVSVRALMNVARDAGWIEANPFDRLTVTQGGKEAENREPWTIEELPILFDDPIWTDCQLPTERKAGGAAAYWMPLIACFTGARLSEIAQLWKDDFHTSKGREVIEFRENISREQRLKNEGSWRAVPMHAELIRLGLPKYVDSLPSGPLFPALPTEGENGAGGQFGKWFGEYKKSKGFASASKSFHSFRHTVATELRLQDATDAQADAITGHAGAGVGRKVYAATIRRASEKLRPVINRLEYPSLRLPAHW